MTQNTLPLRASRRGGGITLSVLVALALVLVTLLGAVALVAFDQTFYLKQYRKLDRPAAIGISEQELMQVTDALMRYLVGLRPDLDMSATINGETQPVFGQRERAHMVDVQHLFIGGLYVFGGAILVAVLGFLALRKLLPGQHFRKIFGRTLVSTLIIVLLLLGAASILIASDFDTWFTRFHHVFFDNDLWLLDPDTEILIQMVPEQFFIAASARIGIYTGLFWAVLLILGCIMARGRYVGKHEKGAIR